VAQQIAGEAPSTPDDVGHQRRLALLIGPEGGFDTGETALFDGHHHHRASLGPRILKTDTAAIAALAIIQAYFGGLEGHAPIKTIK
jgi:16S rRNA (uracil1498-N3)-methyltransferase